MSLFVLQIPRSYADGRTYFAAYIDEQRVAVEEWAQQIVHNFSQIALDVFGSTYSYGSQGLATRSTSVIDAFAAIAENETISGSWTFSGTTKFTGTTSVQNSNNFNIYSDGGATSKFSVDGATGNTLIAGTLGITGNTSITGNVSITGTSTLTGLVTGADLRIGSGYDLECYSDAGSTLTAQIDSSTGELKLLAVDPPQANFLNHLSGVKAFGYWDDTGTATVIPSYNIDSVTDSGNDGLTIITLDRDFSSVNFVVLANSVEVSDTRVSIVSPVISSASQVYFYTYRITENTNSTNEILATDYNFHFLMLGTQ